MPITSRDIWRETWAGIHVLVARGEVDLRPLLEVATYLASTPLDGYFLADDFFFRSRDPMAGMSTSPREFSGSRAVWLGDSHKHSDCGEIARAGHDRVLHQPAHGRNGRGLASHDLCGRQIQRERGASATTRPQMRQERGGGRRLQRR